MHAVSPSSRASRTAKAATEIAAILRTFEQKKSRDRVLTVVVMANEQHRGMTLEKVASYRRLPSSRAIFGF